MNTVPRTLFSDLHRHLKTRHASLRPADISCRYESHRFRRSRGNRLQLCFPSSGDFRRRKVTECWNRGPPFLSSAMLPSAPGQLFARCPTRAACPAAATPTGFFGIAREPFHRVHLSEDFFTATPVQFYGTLISTHHRTRCRALLTLYSPAWPLVTTAVKSAATLA